MNKSILAYLLTATTLDKVFLLPFFITSSANAFFLSNPSLPLPLSSSRTLGSAPSSSNRSSSSSSRNPTQPRHQAAHILLSPSSQLFSTSDDFIDMLLDPPDADSPTFKCTHMIAVPLEQNHDLLLELESVQRGILYHCPLLFEACVAPVVMRMPLLLIDTNHCNGKDGISFPSSDVLLGGSRRNALEEEEEKEQKETEEEDIKGNSLLTSRDPITQTLHKIVKEVVQELIYTKHKMDPDDNRENDNDDNDNHREGENVDQIRPVMMKFQGLEIDGHDNEILHAIGTEDGATPLLRQVVEEIAKRVEQTNGRWKAYLPQDRPQGKKGGLDGDEQTWRPRIPFMRLPFRYWENLPPLASGGGQVVNSEDGMEYHHDDDDIRTPEEGGNGISPIFWYKWWDDRLCNGNGVRIRELAVYGRTGPMGTSEQAFYIPHLRVRLPDGNSVLQKEERNNEKYDKMRRNEQEMKLDNDDFNIADEAQRFEKQMANFKSTADRRMLQTVYDLSPSEAEEVDELAESLKEESRREMEDLQETLDHANGSNNDSSSSRSSVSGSNGSSGSSSHSNVDATTASPSDPRDNDEINSQTSKDIIRGIAKPIATGEWSTYTEELKKKKKPLPKDNPILQNWKNRRSMAMNNGDINPPRKILAPYPSDEHFAGIWSIVSTPMGTIPSNEQDPSASTSANNEILILRIDGSIAGGPILDTVNRHRAAGGTWKFFQAEWCGKSDNTSDDNPAINRGIQTRLRIRLVIPPSKTQVLVMEGEVKRGGTGPFSAESVSKENAKELFSTSSFGLNRISEDGFFSNNSEKDESFLFVSGEAWVEDTDVQDSSSKRQKRSKLGRFAMVKKTDRHPNQYSYSIPPPTRYQD